MWPIPMSPNDVSGLGDGSVLAWVMAWCFWRQAITWATDDSYYAAMWRGSVKISWLWPSFVLVIPTQLNNADLGRIILEYCFIKLYMIFPFQSKCHYFSEVGFHPTHHVFKWTNVSHSSKLATSCNCIFAQMHTFWSIPGPRYFSHMVRSLLLYVSFRDYNCHVCI